MDIHHDGSVHRDFKIELADEPNHGKILHENRVRTDGSEIPKELLQIPKFVFVDQVVDCDIKPHAVRVCKGNGTSQRLVVKVHVLPVQTHIEMLAAEINGVRARFDGCLQCIPISRRSEKLNRRTFQNHEIYTPR